jgi:phenylalanyl-tRNA synthetase beta chain
MNISVSWLRDLVPGLRQSPREIADRLSTTAVVVDEIVPVGEGLEDVRVARVLEVSAHPDADRLLLCRVDVGEGEPVEVVCGAPVVEEGALYPYVGPGGRLPGGMEIEVREIRGRTSRGMLCSEKELGLGPDAGGIMRLTSELEPGEPLSDALELPDARLVLDVTPNRVDLACHVGVAREVAPGGQSELVLPRFAEVEWEPEWTEHESSADVDGVTVSVDAPDRCERYLGAVVRGVEVGPSPPWLASRLRAIGARPVNNVVDATNFVLHERNQPLHAFDLAAVRGPELRARAAAAGETLRTLDGRERELSPGMTVIADAEGPVALAGVMGGEETEVTGETTDVFLECASFDTRATRRTAAEAELSTDASYRFERGIDRRGLEDALQRCVELVLTVAGGRAGSRAVRVGRPAPEPRVLELRPGRVETVLGRSFGPGELQRLLDPLGFETWTSLDDDGGAVLACQVPGWRRDVTREIDLVEEVARRHGYESFPSEVRAFRPSSVPDDPRWRRSERVRELLHGRGLLEARSSSLVGAEEADPEGPVELRRPLSADEGYLRGSLVAVLLRRLEHNWARGQEDVRLYEIGTTFRREPPEEWPGGRLATPRYGEELRVGLAVTGRRAPEHWSGPSSAWDVWDLKGLAADVAEGLCRAGVTPLSGEGAWDLARRFAAERWIGGEAFGIVRDGVPLGIGGRIRPEAVDAPPWADPVWGLEFRLDAVQAGEEGRDVHRPLSEYPPVHRDVAVTVPRHVEAAEVERDLQEGAPEWLESVRLFDVYEGEEIPADRRSLAYRLRFRAGGRTLEDDEVEEAVSRIVDRLESRHDARLRES